MSKLKPYPKYKDSGVAWIGEVPEGWENRKISRSFMTIGSGTTPKSDKSQFYDEGTIPWVTTSELREAIISHTVNSVTEQALNEYSALKIYPSGTLLIAMYGATIGRIGILAINATCNQACCALANGITLEIPFVYHWFQSFKTILQTLASGGGQPNLSQEFIREIRISAPECPEQQTIAAYLDRKTAQIDALIAKKTRSIELLREKRQTMITHAVTKGLNPNAKMKDSGIEWIGDVPEGWDVQALKHISNAITVGIVVNPSEYISEDGLPFIYGGDIKEGEIDFINSRKISLCDSELNKKTQLYYGDILTVRVGYPGVTSVVPKECEGGNCASVMHIRRGMFNSYWLSYAMNSRVIKFQIEVVKYGAAQEQFNISHAVEFLIPSPPLSEQQAIVAFLDNYCGKLNTLITKTERSIELLKEKRQALITAAVTGKIDVREAAPEVIC